MLAVSTNSTIGDLNTVTRKEKAAMVAVVGVLSVAGSELAGGVLLIAAGDQLLTNISSGQVTVGDVVSVVPLGRLAKISGASEVEARVIEAIQVLDTINEESRKW